MLTRVTKLSDKCMLVKTTIRRAALTKRDQFITEQVQAQYGDQSLSVVATLFKDKNSPIREITTALNEVYAYHRKHTLPYVDAGPRMLPSNNYMDYTQAMRDLIARVDRLKAQHMPNYDQYVQDDVSYRRLAAQAKGHPSTASVSDYPTADQFNQSTSIEFRFTPMPDSRHFLFDLSDEDMAAFEAAEQEAVQQANVDTVARMLKPLSALVSRLKEYQGQKGERFHNSLIENVVEGCDLALSLAINPTEELTNEINSLRTAAQACLADVEIIKGSANAREAAKRKLEEVAARMSAFA